MPTPERSDIIASLYAVIDVLNEQLPKGRKLEKSPELVLVGPGSAVDSLMLINLVVETEGRMSEDFGREVTLVDLVGLPPEHNPFRTLGALADDLVMRAAAT
ncbi:MAG: hypothetical protein ACRES9_07990 [Gammaproteobacteria bacterium]